MAVTFERVFVLLGPKNPLVSDSWIGHRVSELVQARLLPTQKVYRAVAKRFTDVGDGARRVNALRPQDAAAIYTAVHTGSTLVIADPSVRVLLDPRREPASPRTVCAPSDLLRHKAVTWVVRDRADLDDRLARLTSPHPCDDIDNVRDPRLLPLHMFHRTDANGELATTAGRSRFLEAYRRGNAWVGSKGTWQDADPRARHGRSREGGPVVVSGWEVPDGHHWDVQPGRTHIELIGLNEVWVVKLGGHLNVFPDAALLGMHNTRRAWPA